ncbi:hypothetical protein RB195_011868 [Necator americanus]|uniref:Receptor L-domain domain-containing protein n=1 Tax=Necator americanus TaxID=51031 RepID=A0ABR1D5D2_NECAM
MSDVSNSFSAWETLPEDEPPLCIAVRRPVSPPRQYEAVTWRDKRSIAPVILYLGYDLIIVNNSQLETMAGGALLTINPSVQIENNPLLDPNCSHVLQYYPDKRRIRGNRSNCGCELDVPLTNTNVNDVEDNCTAIIGNLYLFGPNVPSAEILKRKFGNVYLVSGEVAVVNTDYDDLKFLGNLQSVEFYYGRMWPNALERFVRIENNTALKTLSWPKLKEVVSATILITNNPNLCYSVFELNGLLESRFVDQINGKVCEEIHPNEDGARVCRIGEAATISNIPGNCQILVGDLTIDQSSPEEELWKLYNVTRIYGSLTIRNSSLIGFSSMWKLRDVYNLAGRSALVIDSNTYLKSIYLMYIFRISSELPVRITDNKRLDMSPAECDLLSDSGRIEYDGNKRDCSGELAYVQNDT